MTAIEAKLDAVMSRFGSNERRMHTAHEVGSLDEGERRKSDEEGPNHEGYYQVEEGQYLNANRSYTFKPNPNLSHPRPPPRRMKGVRYYNGTLYLLFQTLVGPSLITESKYHIQRYKINYHRSGVYNVNTYSLESHLHIHIQKLYIYIYIIRVQNLQ